MPRSRSPVTSIGTTGAHRAEVPLHRLPARRPTAAEVARRASRPRGRSRATRSIAPASTRARFPQISATTPDGYTVAATAFDPPPTGVTPQIDLYAVSPAACRGS